MIFPWWFSRCSASVRNAIATAGVLGGLTGLLLGGFWIGAAGFVATSYLAKKDGPRVSSGWWIEYGETGPI